MTLYSTLLPTLKPTGNTDAQSEQQRRTLVSPALVSFTATRVYAQLQNGLRLLHEPLRHMEETMTRNRSYHPVTGRLYRLLTTMLTIVGMAILCVLGVSCELTEGTLMPSSEEDGSNAEINGEEVFDEDEFDAYALAIKFWEEDIYQNEEVFVDFVEEVDGLNMTQTELLVGEIDRLVAELNPSTARLSENIHVYWDSWPSGSYPNAVYVVSVAACGWDYDVGARYNNVPNAYNSPGALWFETNSAVVYGVMSQHSYEALAYDITTSNTVRICVGVGGSSSYWFVNSMKNYFWGGLAINH